MYNSYIKNYHVEMDGMQLSLGYLKQSKTHREALVPGTEARGTRTVVYPELNDHRPILPTIE